MVRPTTLNGTKDVLLQYSRNEYCIICDKSRFLLVSSVNMEDCMYSNNKYDNKHKLKALPYYRYTPMPLVHISRPIMAELIDEGFVTINMSDKEWDVQIALGTAPEYRLYMITGKKL